MNHRCRNTADRLQTGLHKASAATNGRRCASWVVALIALLLFIAPRASAQVGEYRSTFSIGGNAGYNLNTIRFTPKVVQSMHGGMTGGLTMRYTVEKYFATIASITAEVNYAQLGWKEAIRTIDHQPVVNAATQLPEQYSRTINYIQVPFMTHLAWGRETNGVNFFVNAGPQFGFYLGESTKSNFDWNSRNMGERANTIVAQDTMAVENKFDYGITAGIGVEYSHPKLGHYLVEARYYYGLGNIYGDSKRDYFGSSNHQTITVKLAYLFDLIRHKPQKTKQS